MKNAKCSLTNITLCAMAVSVLGLFGTAVFLAAVAAKKTCSDIGDCAAESAEPEAE